MNQNRIQIQSSSGREINSIEKWLQHAPPKRGNFHWKDGRSAKELAKAWFRQGVAAVPEEIVAIMMTQAATQGFVGLRAVAEKTTKLDDFGGERRNNDLVVYGRVAGGPVVVAIEAKADEPFGNQKIGPYFDVKVSSTSNVSRRIEFLCKSAFGRPLDTEIRQLRYQLLHGLAAAMIEAKEQEASQAVFLVHEFLSKELNVNNVEGNHWDLERFIQALLKRKDFALPPGSLVGPICVPGGEFVPAELPVFIGKASVSLLG